MPSRISLGKRLRYALEYAIVRTLFALFGTLSLDTASGLGGWLGRTLGPRFAVSRRARDNLRLAFPDASAQQVERIVVGMWDNLGRVAAEYPHLGAFAIEGPQQRIDLCGRAHLDATRDDNKGAVFFAAHLANWELCPITAALSGLPLGGVFRAPNNPWVAGLLERIRAPIQGALYGKGQRGMRTMIKDVRHGGHVGILIDQKYNEGQPVLFFGRPAMTSTAAADLALRLDVPVLPTRVERLRGAHFRVTIYPPLVPPETTDRAEAARAMTAEMTEIIEHWVRDQPDQWLWLHRRWPQEDRADGITAPSDPQPEPDQGARRTN